MVSRGCKDCENRHIGCHSNCEAYKQFKDEGERIKDIKRKNNQVNWDVYCVRMNKVHLRGS